MAKDKEVSDKREVQWVRPLIPNNIAERDHGSSHEGHALSRGLSDSGASP
jgi:hypothetical protein